MIELLWQRRTELVVRSTRNTQSQTCECYIAQITRDPSVGGGPRGAIAFGSEVQGVLKRGRGVAVGEVHELEWNALLVSGYAEISEDHMDKAGVAGAFGKAVVGKRGGWQGGVDKGCRGLGFGQGGFRGCAFNLSHDGGM